MKNSIRFMYSLLGALLLSLPIGAQAQDALESLTQVQDYETRRVSSSHDNLHKNGDARSIEPGETLVLGELEGPGMITHIWNTVAAYDPFYGLSLIHI